MASRLLVCVLAFAVVASPVAADVCHVTCATHGMGAAHVQTRHHSCAPSAPAAGPLVSAVPHACGHQSEEPVGVERALHTLAAPSVDLEMAAVPSVDIVAPAAFAFDTTRRPAGPPNLTRQ